MKFLRNVLKRGTGDHGAPSVEVATLTLPTADAAGPAVRQSKLCVGWLTHVGAVRRHNEDAALIITAVHDGDVALPAFGLFILADGMGGHQAGEVASSLAARTMAHHIVQQLYLPTLSSDEYGASQPALNEALSDAVRVANLTVSRNVPGGGTTLTGALLLGQRVYIAHVGDSRAYMIAAEEMEQITRDHSLVDRLVELGQLTPEEATTHPQKNVLYRAVGQGEGLDPDTYVRTIPPGGQLLLCSDGLWTMVSPEEIARIVITAPSPQAACESLIAAANEAGGLDNITAILVKPPLG